MFNYLVRSGKNGCAWSAEEDNADPQFCYDRIPSCFKWRGSLLLVIEDCRYAYAQVSTIHRQRSGSSPEIPSICPAAKILSKKNLASILPNHSDLPDETRADSTVLIQKSLNMVLFIYIH